MTETNGAMQGYGSTVFEVRNGLHLSNCQALPGFVTDAAVMQDECKVQKKSGPLPVVRREVRQASTAGIVILVNLVTSPFTPKRKRR